LTWIVIPAYAGIQGSNWLDAGFRRHDGGAESGRNSGMDIQQERSDGMLVISPSGRIDSTTSDALEQVLTQAFEAGDRRLVVDFDRVSSISSAGLRVLLVAAKRLRAERGVLVLCALGEPVRQVFDLAGFLPLFAVERSRDLALARCAGG
jgi:anti-anti-sigma factor